MHTRMLIVSATRVSGLEVEMSRSGSHDLTSEGLERFLVYLDPNREQAGVKYQSLHRKLVKLLEWRGAPYAESLVDGTIDGVIRKLQEVDPGNWLAVLSAHTGHPTSRVTVGSSQFLHPLIPVLSQKAQTPTLRAGCRHVEGCRSSTPPS